MPKRRGHGEGTIRQRPDGSWEARVTVGVKDDGKPKRLSFYGKDRKDVAAKLAKAVNEMNTGTFVEPAKTTLKNWYNTWLWEYKKPSLKAASFTRYESLSRVHILPALGDMFIKDIRPEHIQKLINDKSKAGLSPRTLKYIHVTLHNSFEQAMKNGLIMRNVADAVTLPQQKKKEIQVFTPAEQVRFMEAVKGNRLEAAFILDLFTGLRLGELLALTWDDIDFKEGVLRVSRTIQRVKTYKDTGNKSEVVIQDSPKTKAGFRSIPILDDVAAVLKRHRKAQTEEKQNGGATYQDNGFVFSNELGGPIEPRQMIKYFEAVLQKAGLAKLDMPEGWKPGDRILKSFKFPKWFTPPDGWEPGKALPKDFVPPEGITFHALRHTFATRGLENGIAPKVMQEILGHTSITMTLDLYSHVLPDTKKDAIQKLKGLFKSTKNV